MNGSSEDCPFVQPFQGCRVVLDDRGASCMEASTGSLRHLSQQHLRAVRVCVRGRRCMRIELVYRRRRFGREVKQAVVTLGMLAALTGWGAGSPKDYCKKDFPELWASFVDRFTDGCITGGAAAAKPTEVPPPLPAALPPVARLVAIGDIHGDLPKARRAFRLAGLINEEDRWTGGTTTVVQVGDQLDRGNDEIGVLYFLERLQQEAQEAGGALHVLNGNHETMNAVGRFRYATLPAIASFDNYQELQDAGSRLKALCRDGNLVDEPLCPEAARPRPREYDGGLWARRAALSPGGSVARRFLAPHPIVLQVGSTVFVHGGLTPAHVRYGVERINAETRAWLLGTTQGVPAYLEQASGPVWTRDYSAVDERQCKCADLEEALSMLPGRAERMVVGHTIQDNGITTACDSRVFRVDVGLSAGCGDGEPEVLEILNDVTVRRLREGQRAVIYPPPPSSHQPGDPLGETCSVAGERSPAYAA